MKPILLSIVLFALSSCVTIPVDEPLPVKVVVVTMFEIGEDTGDRAGEFQLWKERRDLTEVLPFHGWRDLHYDPKDDLLVMVTGIGTARSASAVMALGMDDRFDLSTAYCLSSVSRELTRRTHQLALLPGPSTWLMVTLAITLMQGKFLRSGHLAIFLGIPWDRLTRTGQNQRVSFIT